MIYLLDTNICIHFFRGEFNLLQKFDEVNLSNCCISEITLAELSFGAESSSNPEKNHLLITSFIENITVLPIFSAINHYAKEKVRLRRQGLMISDFDLLIGSTAVSYDLIMVTENTKEFKRIKALELENWVDRASK